MKRFIFCIILTVFSNILINPAINSNGILILTDGREYRGKLILINDSAIVFEIDGKETFFDRKTVNKINFERSRLYDDSVNVSGIKDKEIRAAFEESKKWKPTEDYDSVILLDKLTYDFENDLSVKMNIKKIFKILNENGKDLSTQYFHYMRNYYKANLLYALTILPDGKVFSIDEQAINDEPMNNFNANYDRLNRIKFGLKNTDIGSIIVWEAVITGRNDGLDNQFFLEKNLASEKPISRRIVEISVPDKMNVASFLSKGIPDEKKPGMTKMKSGNKTVYTYDESNVREFINDEDNLPSSSMIYPFLYSGFETGWEKITADFYDKYFSAPISAKITGLARKIAGVEKDKDIIIKKIYEHVNRRIELADIGFSEAGYTPASEELIAEHSSLNVLDKSYLFSRLCRSLDINVSMSYYRNSSRGGLIYECPSLKQFDSVICESNGVYYSFEDVNFGIAQRNGGTSEASRLEVSAGSSKPSMLRKILPEENSVKTDYICELKNDDVLIMTRTTVITGSAQTSWRAKRFLTGEEFDKWEKSRMTALGKDVEVMSYRFTNPLNDFEKPVIFEEKLRIRNFSFSSGKNLKLFQLPDLSFQAGNVAKPERQFPFHVGGISSISLEYEIKLPPGYKAVRMADNVNTGSADVKFGALSAMTDDRIIVKINSVVNRGIIDASEYGMLKNWYETKAKFSQEWFIIKSGK